jgi:hypothetical protein
MKTAVIALVLLASSGVSIAQGVPTLADIRKATDAAMSLVGKGDLEAGLKSFKPLTIVPSAEFDALVGQTTQQLPLLTARFGSNLGSEFIKEDRIGESLARSIYIHRFDKHAMRWIFYLYRGKDGWVINTFRFDDKWPELLQ